ncbi:hypothetical protein CGMCC3_g3946 [Colletotrichum fructicola]|uniref:Uncharacterized protein n=1 Tax=Colletotrichum fructicola (strain Nara gc5) TaxID=1213859 RepID=L2FQY5_COLFN|nr:uncharacterized protein CGMCC3_g3946 [Colletotrichum fructicola]KAE9580176.1 hypothetical protein CGMCC3_g3946 [Colletotrichum fructicola]KAF4479297.1 hypothetical protein CGGC5_v012099 [Colletotrichum fructicola Nara gc5]KAF5490911.1 hypothetical protein CGCF413_v011053 [Colletotrichum fructicola]
MSTFEGEAFIPSHDALCAAHQPPKLSSEARRLFWNIDGPLDSVVHIMATERDTSSLEPYFQDHAWHPFSQAALTEPKVSSMTVVVDDLNEWEDVWLECHREHTDPDCADEVEEEETDADTHWGLLPDYDPASDEDGPLRLLKCCETQRPRGKTVIVVVRPAVGSFVTIHDYLSTVHPLLLRSRADLLNAMGDVMENEPLPSETKLMVDYHMPHHLVIREQDDWFREVSRPPNPLLASMAT